MDKSFWPDRIISRWKLLEKNAGWVYKHFYYPHLTQQDDATSARAAEPLHGVRAVCVLIAKQAAFAFARIP